MTTISERPQMLRVGAPRGIDRSQVDRKNSVIAGFSVITRGEARGHKRWIDSTFLDQVVEAGNAAVSGVKSRFTHPGLSGDGMGNQLGRAKNFRRDGDRVLADLHLYEKSNQEKVAEILNLAEEDPAAFGASIVFAEDRDAMQQFEAEHTDKQNGYQSPDEDNAANHIHTRLKQLYAADAVDEPAANPNGLFTAGSELPARAESILAYALGLTDDEPDELTIGPHPERARAFLAGFMDRHGLQIVHAGTTTDDKFTALERRVDTLGQKLNSLREFTLRQGHTKP